MLLELEGHEVLRTSNGTVGARHRCTGKPSIILLDIGLPGLDGYEVCGRLRQQGLTTARIIAVTGYGRDRDRVRSREAGFDAHTVKPVDPSELIGLLVDC